MNQPRRVLVVEDDPDTRDALQSVLEGEGYEVLAAENGRDALDAVANAAPDLILLDLRMPVMDGRTFARLYRESPGPHAPIIVLTAAADAAQGAAEVGAAAYLPKPFGVLDLLDTIQHCPGLL